MRKSSGILGTMAKNRRQKATKAATGLVYQVMWGEKPTSKKKK